MLNSQLLKGLSINQIKAERCRRSFYYFFLEFWETIESVELIDNWHIKFICDKLQEVYNKWEIGESQKDIIINIPPGTSKSTTITQAFPAWLWVKNSSIRIISSSYSSDLSTSHSVKSRDILKSDKYQEYFPGQVIFKDDEDNKTNYKNQNKGQRFSTSTGGAVTGMHADFIIVDDPINPKKAGSEVELKTANSHITQTLSTRKTDKNRSVTIIVMQRLHENDPTGEALRKRKDKIEHICLPGELSDNVSPVECKEKYVNGLLDPIRLNRQALDALKTDLGSYGYAGQIAQRPNPEGGGKIKKAWFKNIEWEEFKEISKGYYPDYFADTAYTEKTENDPSALMTTYYIGNILYILNSTTVYKEFPELLRFVKSYLIEFGYTNKSKLMIEPKASGKSIVQSFKNTEYNVLELPTTGDSKITRVTNNSAFIEAGRVCLVEGAWNDSFLNECTGFPNAEHDDQVDNLSSAIEYYNKPVSTTKFTSHRRR